jgi:hypothetical protein
MAADGSVETAGEDFRLQDPPQAGLRWDSLRSPFAAKSSLPSAGCLAALALCARLAASALFRRSGRYGHRTWRKPQNMLVQTNRAGWRGCASGFGCLPSTPLSPVQ